jgi:hypothetical protein
MRQRRRPLRERLGRTANVRWTEENFRIAKFSHSATSSRHRLIKDLPSTRALHRSAGGDI